ncbi:MULTISPECIES: restriction endonuclease subunit S [Flavobacterium]|jgi:type I restriction enzyme S subunit|uniref:Restriction endonuclease n=2 Tax=Flavobacterium TaxID=237 RepID=A0A085ZZF9_FLAHY|nr:MULTISPECIES: restriction endonuclease subunit S [Flavobacterium]KFF09823.1 restriction endonuclease [Flavobacterium hydatis]OHT43751.1 restriction endonuclease [Flavobacterium tructae]OXA89373.1 restriction endonuclease [Flavobacterium hydatis]OXB20520.1 restriction endonuclease [Flavobacterium tructae]
MIKYEKYKPSEIDWLGEIPSKWEVKRIKDVFKQISLNGNKLSENCYIPLENIEQFTGKLIQRVSNDNNETTNLFNSGDILINKLRPYLGKIYLPDFNGGVSGEVVVLRSIFNGKFSHSKYFFYRFLSTKFIFKINSMTDGVKMPRTNPTKILNLNIAIPQLKEQIEIANYLDSKTQAIDKKINLLIQKANYYKEYRKSIINEAVCKGLDKNVKFKNSDINYINDIPQHWKIERIKDLFNIGRGRVIGQELLVEEGKYPVYSSQTENNGCLGYIETYDFDNDLLTWTTDGANAGTVFRRSGKFNCTNVCGTLIPKRKNLDLDYVVYALQESATHNKRIDTNGAKIMNNEMAVINIAFPPLNEQTEIAKYLDTKIKTTDKIVENINTQIIKLKELRKTLINDVVTGKIKVT